MREQRDEKNSNATNTLIKERPFNVNLLFNFRLEIEKSVNWQILRELFNRLEIVVWRYSIGYKSNSNYRRTSGANSTSGMITCY